MARRKQTKGACAYCGRVLTRGGMSRHLESCSARQAQIELAGTALREGTFLHLQVKDAYEGRYWVHLEMAGSAPLKTLDRYLRALWLECCGHLSRFFVGGAWTSQKLPMSRKADPVLQPGDVLTHVYDFGTSSETVVEVVAARRGRATTRHPLALMARNGAPVFTCMECDRTATWQCMECVYEDEREGTLCEKHARVHPHEDYGAPLPLVNSPRVGMCGYEGPAEPPY